MIKNQKYQNQTVKIQKKINLKAQNFKIKKIMSLVIRWTKMMKMTTKTMTKKMNLKKKNIEETEEKKKNKCPFIRQQWIF